MLSKHSQLHGGTIAPLQRQKDPAAKQAVSEGHSLIVGQESEVQVLKGSQTWRGDVKVQTVQPGRPESRVGLKEVFISLSKLNGVNWKKKENDFKT